MALIINFVEQSHSWDTSSLQLVKCPTCMEPEGIILCSQQARMCSCSEQNESNPHPHYFWKIHFSVILPSKLKFGSF